MEHTSISSELRREIIPIQCDGAELALHLWRPKHAVGAIFYFHGLQSHAGWLWEAARQFAANGIAFYALDRRGCGISGGPRNEIPPVDVLLGDVMAALRVVQVQIGPDLPLNLFGHCLGGSVLAGLLHYDDFDIPFDSAIFCSTWLGRLHNHLGDDERARIVDDTSEDLWDAQLAAADFTGEAKYQDYINTDPLATRLITRRSRASLLQLERLYVDKARDIANVPYAYLSGRTDPVVPLESSLQVFRDMVREGQTVRFCTDRHYLFFTDERTNVVNWASAFTAYRGFGLHA